MAAKYSDETVRIGASGGQLVSRVDNRITIEFPRRALNQTYKFEYWFQQIDVRRFTIYREIDEKIRSIAGFSGVLHVRNKMSQNSRTVNVTLPLLHTTGDDDGFEVMFIRMKDYMDRGLGPPVSAKSYNNCFSISVKELSIIKDNFSAWKVRRGVLEKQVNEAAKYLTGELSLCTLLTFIQYDEHNPCIVFNCVDAADVEDVSRKYYAEGFVEVPGSRSKYITMTDGTEVQVKLDTNIRPAPEVDKRLLEKFVMYRFSEVSNGIRFPFRTITGPNNDSVVYFNGKTIEHRVTFKLSDFRPETVEVAEEEEKETEDKFDQFKHVGEGCFIEIPSDKEFPDISVKPAEFRSDIIGKIKKKGTIISEVLDIFNTSGGSFDLHIPVNVPKTALPPEKLYDFFVLNEKGEVCMETEIEKWPQNEQFKRTFASTNHREPKPYKVKARVGNWTSFSVIAQKKTETVTVTSEGVRFHSNIDKNITVEISKNARRETGVFEINLNEIDQTTVEGYRSENPELFGVIKSITSGIDIKGKGAAILSGVMKVTLPIRKDPEPDDPNTEVVMVVSHKDHMEEIPVEKTQQKNCYAGNIPACRRAVLVRRTRNATRKTMNAIRYLNGENSLCTIMTFINFDEGRDKPMVRVDCGYNFKANGIADKHRKDDFIEIPHSRSSDREIKNKERISMTLKGNLTTPPHVPKNIYSLIFLQQSSSNHTTVPVQQTKSMRNLYSIIEYTGNKGCTRHTIHFMLNEKTIENLLLPPTGNGQNFENGILSEPSLAVLGEQLTWINWERVGMELGISQDSLDNIRRMNEPHRRPLRLLNHWMVESKTTNETQMAEELATAIEDIGHGDVAAVIRRAVTKGVRLKRKDFR